LCGFVRLCAVLCGFVRFCAALCGNVRFCAEMCGCSLHHDSTTKSPPTMASFMRTTHPGCDLTCMDCIGSNIEFCKGEDNKDDDIGLVTDRKLVIDFQVDNQLKCSFRWWLSSWVLCCLLGWWYLRPYTLYYSCFSLLWRFLCPSLGLW